MGEQKTSGAGGSGDALYAFGIFGAAAYFWQKADDPKGKVLAVLKGLAWPAFLVYEAFSLLEADEDLAEAVAEVVAEASEPI